MSVVRQKHNMLRRSSRQAFTPHITHRRQIHAAFHNLDVNTTVPSHLVSQIRDLAHRDRAVPPPARVPFTAAASETSVDGLKAQIAALSEKIDHHAHVARLEARLAAATADDAHAHRDFLASGGAAAADDAHQHRELLASGGAAEKWEAAREICADTTEFSTYTNRLGWEGTPDSDAAAPLLVATRNFRKLFKSFDLKENQAMSRWAHLRLQGLNWKYFDAKTELSPNEKPSYTTLLEKLNELDAHALEKFQTNLTDALTDAEKGILKLFTNLKPSKQGKTPPNNNPPKSLMVESHHNTYMYLLVRSFNLKIEPKSVCIIRDAFNAMQRLQKNKLGEKTNRVERILEYLQQTEMPVYLLQEVDTAMFNEIEEQIKGERSKWSIIRCPVINWKPSTPPTIDNKPTIDTKNDEENDDLAIMYHSDYYEDPDVIVTTSGEITISPKSVKDAITALLVSLTKKGTTEKHLFVTFHLPSGYPANKRDVKGRKLAATQLWKAITTQEIYQEAETIIVGADFNDYKVSELITDLNKIGKVDVEGAGEGAGADASQSIDNTQPINPSADNNFTSDHLAIKMKTVNKTDGKFQACSEICLYTTPAGAEPAPAGTGGYVTSKKIRTLQSEQSSKIGEMINMDIDFIFAKSKKELPACCASMNVLAADKWDDGFLVNVPAEQKDDAK